MTAVRQPVAALVLCVLAAVGLAPPAPVAAETAATGAAGADADASAGQAEIDYRQAYDIYRSLRCVVCDGESLAASQAQIARDMRAVIRDELARGRSPDEIREAMVARYGEYVLAKPPMNAHTVLLWAAPVAAFALGAGLVVWYYRRTGPRPTPPPLSAREEAELAAMRPPADAPDGDGTAGAAPPASTAARRER